MSITEENFNGHGHISYYLYKGHHFSHNVVHLEIAIFCPIIFAIKTLINNLIIKIHLQGMKQEKNLECLRICFSISKNILACHLPFCLATQIFFVPVSQFGLPFGT